METLHFGNLLTLPILPMGIASAGETLTFRTGDARPLTQLEADLHQAIHAPCVLTSRTGEELQVLRGYTELTAIGKTMVDGQFVTEVTLRKPSPLEERVTLLEGAVADLGQLMGGED